MPAPLSVVIPTLNAAPEVAALLPALMQGVAAGLVREVIITDGGSSDDIAELAEAVGAVFVSGPSGRGAQLRRGVAIARGAWFLVLHADSRLPEGWVPVVQSAMEGDAGAYTFRLGFRATGIAPRIVGAWANLRSRAGLPYGDQGLLVRRANYEAAGGFPAIPLMEDVALVRALGRVKVLPAVLTTSPARYEAEGWVRRGARNLWTLVRYLAGTDPEVLARDYAARRNQARGG
jgi:rSAM/selenodomain-associated transferase 2